MAETELSTPRDKFSSNVNEYYPWAYAEYVGRYNFILTNERSTGNEQELFFDNKPCVFLPDHTDLFELKEEIGKEVLFAHWAKYHGEYPIQNLKEIPQGFSQWICGVWERDGFIISFYRP